MPLSVVTEPSFKRRLKKKTPAMVAAITECIGCLAEDTRHPGLHTHRVQGPPGVFEAYVDASNRVTFHYDDDGRIVLRNHCSHAILARP